MHASGSWRIPVSVDSRPGTKTLSAFLLLLAFLAPVCTPAQNAGSLDASPEPVLHISSDLVLLDVEALGLNDGLPVTALKKEDFQVFDNERLVDLKTFDAGAAALPLALWFVVQCNMRGWETRGSGLFSGQVKRLQPAIDQLHSQDRVAVAHWCDDGDALVDLPPTGNFPAAATSLEKALAPRPDTPNHDRPGELALEKTLQLIVDATRSMPSRFLPVIVFLYGDYSAMPKREANQLAGELLSTSGVAFGLKDRRSPRYFDFGLSAEQGSIANYIATQTGGEYFRVTPETYAVALGEILAQMHARYEIGFKPAIFDGQRHRLRVKLSGGARRRGERIRLRYRAAYVPLPRAGG